MIVLEIIKVYLEIKQIKVCPTTGGFRQLASSNKKASGGTVV